MNTTEFENNHIKIIKDDHEYSIYDKHKDVCVFEIGHNEAENKRLVENLILSFETIKEIMNKSAYTDTTKLDINILASKTYVALMDLEALEGK
jgi:hypothetical protein